MTYAVVDTQTNTVAKDAGGNGHIYSTKTQAQQVCEELNKAGDATAPAGMECSRFTVKPW